MALALLIVGVLFNIFLGVIVSLKRHDYAARALIFVALGLIFWEVSNYAADFGGEWALFWNRMAFLGPLAIMVASYFFIVALRGYRPGKKVITILVLGTALVALLSITPLVVEDVQARFVADVVQGYNPVYGLLYPLYVGWIAVLIAAFSHRAFMSSKHESSRRKSQLSIVRYGAVIAITIPIVTNLILPNILQDSSSAQLVPVVSVVYMGALSIAILRHGMLDIRLATIRSATYVLSLIVLSAIYYFLAYIISRALLGGQTTSTVSVSPINIALALVLAFLFQPIKQFFDRVTNSIFYRDSYNQDDFLTRLSEILATTTTLRSLLERTANEIASTLKAEQAFFFVEYGPDTYICAGTEHHKRMPPQDAWRLNEYVGLEGDDAIAADSLRENDEIYRMLISHEACVVLPLVHSDRILGYLVLGDKRTGGYSTRDMKTLHMIPDEIVIAIQNVLSIQEVRELNETLQQKIDDATKELRASNAQLRKLDGAKDEFISMASHQLRTPLTSIKGYIDMMLEGDAGEITPMQRQFLTEAFVSSERMVHLINDFLNVSRLQTGKFTVEQRPTDVARVVTQELDGLKISASQRGLTFSFKPPKKLPQLLVDEAKIRQVVMNFADNALYYSKPNSTIRVALKQDDEDIIFTIKDTGIGVPEAEQAELFTKFFRATNARKQRPDGTGVGLYLAKRVVVAHGGSIIFSSEEGKGSTFGFRLPLEPLRVRDNAD